MATEIVLPRLGWNMEKGSLGEWLKQDGDRVEAGEILFTVEGDKAVQEIEALDSGVLRIPADSPPPGKEVPVGTLLAYLVQPGEAVPSATRPAEGVVPPSRATSAGVVAPARPQAAAPHVTISPRARRAARELGLDWARLTGSGRTGRIVERDVRQAALGKAAGLAEAEQAKPGVPAWLPARLAPLDRPIQQGIAAHLTPSAQVTLTTEADATELVRLRSHLQGATEPVPSYTDFLVKAVATALTEYPQLNARLEGDAVVVQPTVSIGIAVDTERGFIVPVIHDAQGKSLRQIARESAELAEKARSGGITAQDVQGGTFTVTDLGLYDIDAFTPIINSPQGAVLGVGRIVAKQIVLDADAGQVAIRRMVFLSLAFDRQMVDGAAAARFLQRVKLFVEQPYLWLVC
jgi:pyruvate dehydrogenase E2 component (dihydrolipoamide acetyltransferase)